MNKSAPSSDETLEISGFAELLGGSDACQSGPDRPLESETHRTDD